jgi:hypothetical protein
MSTTTDTPRPLRLTPRGRFARDVAQALGVSLFFAAVVYGYGLLTLAGPR